MVDPQGADPKRAGRCQIEDHQHWIYAPAATGRRNSGEKRERGEVGGKSQGEEVPAAALIAAGWTSTGELRRRRGVGEEGAGLLGGGGGAARITLGATIRC